MFIMAKTNEMVQGDIFDHTYHHEHVSVLLFLDYLLFPFSSPLFSPLLMFRLLLIGSRFLQTIFNLLLNTATKWLLPPVPRPLPDTEFTGADPDFMEIPERQSPSGLSPEVDGDVTGDVITREPEMTRRNVFPETWIWVESMAGYIYVIIKFTHCTFSISSIPVSTVISL